MSVTLLHIYVPRVDHYGYLGAATVDASEELEIRRARRIVLFERVGILQQGETVLDLLVCFIRTGETLQRSAGSVDAVRLDAPRGRLGGQPHDQTDGKQPDPLDGKGDAVGPGRVGIDQTAEDAGGDETPDGPREGGG